MWPIYNIYIGDCVLFRNQKERLGCRQFNIKDCAAFIVVGCRAVFVAFAGVGIIG